MEKTTKLKEDKNFDKKSAKVSFTETIIKYYKKEWKLASIIIAMTLLSVVCSVLLPLLTNQITKGIMIDNGLGGTITGYWGSVWWVYLLIGVGLLIFNMVFMYISQYTGVLMAKRVEIDLRNQALEKLVKQDISYYSNKKIGEILTKIISDTQIVGDQAYQIPTTMLRATLTVIGSFVMMFIFDWKVSLVVLGTLILVILLILSTFGIIKSRSNNVRTVITDINGFVTDRINNVRLIKSNGTENRETEGFKEVHKKYYKANVGLAKIVSFMVVALFGGVTLLQLITIAASAGFYHGNGPEVTQFWITNFASLSMAQGLLVGAIMQTMMITVNLANATVSTARVYDTINSKALVDPHYDGSGIYIDEIKGDIKFEGVEFAYPEKPEKVILPKFDFTFKEGKSYAFVGETGSGKSTISRLLLRYYDPTEGEVLINNDINLKDVNLASYLSHVGYVEQEPQILFGNVYDNIRYGTFNATDEQVIAAAKKADLHDLVMTWPEGYNTVLGERGFMLSGGQKQRLVIARMFLKDPQILILDEATSALDNIVEKEIQGQLDSLMKGRTTISIAHRLSTIKNVDQIVVLGANGKGIVQTGTFDELKNKPGHFQKLYQAGLMD